jgi:hypothetical protein
MKFTDEEKRRLAKEKEQQYIDELHAKVYEDKHPTISYDKYLDMMIYRW